MRSDEGAAFGPALLAQVPATMSTVDRGLVTELFYGVLRHRAALDWRLAACSQRHLARLAPPTLTLLRVGAYQLLFLARVPASAAVNETVALTKRLSAPADVGFVNAVLRALDRRRHELIVPDLLERPLDHLTAEYSHPVWLVRRWLKRFGVQRTLHLCRANNAIPPMTLRVNTLVTTRERLLDVLRQEGVEAAPCAVSPQGVVIRGTPPTATRAFAQGWYYVQDEAAQLVGLAVAPRPGERVLDACAAPGGKSIHLAELMGDHGEVVAADVKPDRLGLVTDNCRRMGIKSVRTVAADLTQASDVARLGRFDRILVDAPCTGLGVLRRHPEAKWHKTEGLIARYAATQRAILDQVAPLLTPGGVLIYSTCSTEREENEEVVSEFLRRHRGWVSDDLRAVLPAAAASLVTPQGYLLTLGNAWDMDGFFAAHFTYRGTP
jgi:16S rRNA (cytosine967-C5)-methyltransferase